MPTPPELSLKVTKNKKKRTPRVHILLLLKFPLGIKERAQTADVWRSCSDLSEGFAKRGVIERWRESYSFIRPFYTFILPVYEFFLGYSTGIARELEWKSSSFRNLREKLVFDGIVINTLKENPAREKR